MTGARAPAACLAGTVYNSSARTGDYRMSSTPLSESIHIVLAGVTNAGKSSLMNALFDKDVAVVSAVAGTTTDPVTRKIELDKIGPCSITDTAGLGDTGDIGNLRIQKTTERLETADIVLFVSPSDKPVTAEERELLAYLSQKKMPYIGVLTFADKTADDTKKNFFPPERTVTIDNTSHPDTKPLLLKIESLEKEIDRELTPLEGIVKPKQLVVLVTPIDLSAPKGRLILPQVETLRDALDRDCAAVVVKESELTDTYKLLARRPDIVITDSQAFGAVKNDIPQDQLLTSFSILFARKKGDISYYIRSLGALAHFPKDGKVLVMEACAHHQLEDDIGTIKIPNLFHKLVSKDAVFSHSRGMPQNPKDYDLIIHCAGCMLTRRAIEAETAVFKEANVPELNYGLFLAWANGLLPRALEPFPELCQQKTL